MGNETPKDGDPAPCQRDPKTEAFIERCVQTYTSIFIDEEFLNTHQQAIADLYVAAKLPLPFPADRRVQWQAANDVMTLMKSTLRAIGLSEDEITLRLNACYDERAYPTDARFAPRRPTLARFARKAYASLSRFFGRMGWKWRRLSKGAQRDLYH